MFVSVVICTYNRAEGLRQALECLRQQQYSDFEVVVVNGPSTDHTEAVLADYREQIKIVTNDAANLSISRNLGIRASGGDVVAFIDDDALPEPRWLVDIVAGYDDDAIGGVGGVVIDHTGMRLQACYLASDRFGRPRFSDSQSFEACSVPGADVFPQLLGTNSTFRRSALAEIGLFDETFNYYLDETDVCCRLVDHGYVLRQLAGGAVHHKYLPSAVRNEHRIVTNWYSIVRNHIYFGYRHALLDAAEVDVLQHAGRFVESALAEAAGHERAGVAPAGHHERAREACGPAIGDGIALGRDRAELKLPATLLGDPGRLRYPTRRAPDALRVVLVSSGYPPHSGGGIGRFVGDVAPVLARLGHEVRVFTRTADEPRVDLEDGVWVHRLGGAATPGILFDGPPAVDAFATAVSDELQRIDDWFTPDVVYGSLWDAELLGIARSQPEVRLVPMLATPAAEVAAHEGWDQPDHPDHATFHALYALETELMKRATVVHGISDAIVGTVQKLYPEALDPSRVLVAHIGRSEIGGRATPPQEGATFLFVGRLEPRKGIDTFLRAAAEVARRHERAQFRVVGSASRPAPTGESYSAMWKRHAGGNSSRLTFLGELSDEELLAEIDASHAVVMPSRYESFGLVAVEAMSRGRAVVVSDVGGLAEVVVDGVTGRRVAVADVDALVAAMSELLLEPRELVARGNAGRRHFENHHHIDRAAERLVHVLRVAVAAELPIGA